MESGQGLYDLVHVSPENLPISTEISSAFVQFVPWYWDLTSETRERTPEIVLRHPHTS